MDTGSEDPPSSLPLTVFLFGYCQAKLGNDVGHRLEVSASEIAEKFNFWQMKLGLAELHQKSDLQSTPLPLFTFPAGEHVNFWTDPAKSVGVGAPVGEH